jgi:hypothetical protein
MFALDLRLRDVGWLRDEFLFDAAVDDFDLIGLSLFAEDSARPAVEAGMEAAFLHARVEIQMNGVASLELLDGLLWRRRTALSGVVFQLVPRSFLWSV